jgi:plastocyanin
MMRTTIPTRLVALGAAVGLAFGMLSSGSALAGGKTIKVGDNYFVKPGGSTVTVKRGTTITWRWAGAAPHNVTVRKGPARFASKTQAQGTFAKRITKRGTYSLICTIHGSAMTMKLRVT